ncbi:PINIT domain-containing protein [Trichophaea hybrida]|nr:PINIT domain-containing protein [Trichophaea hybrida]
MSASTSIITRENATSLIRFVNSHLIVRQLQAVLKLEGQPTSGLKSPLQQRLTSYIENIVKDNDVQAFERVKSHVYNSDAAHAPARAVSSSSYPPVSNGYSPTPTGRTNPPNYNANGSFTALTNLPKVTFRESPFYKILERLGDHAKCPIMSTHRNTVSTIVTLSPSQVQQLNNDKSIRCMVYCAVFETLTPFSKDTDISFPHQVELRVNDAVVTGLNLRGLKNKPGSTRPADITDKLNIRANYRNEIGLTYAQTQKEFSFVVNLVKTETVDNLVRTLRNGGAIAKETVIADSIPATSPVSPPELMTNFWHLVVKKNEDADLVATSAIMSLKCPLSTLRIDLPVRSLFCTHIQCFDATSFLQLQQQAPTWTCPTCNKSITFKQLVIDRYISSAFSAGFVLTKCHTRYFEDILENTRPTVESVTINADGQWSAVEASNSPVPESSDDEGGDNVKREFVDLEDGLPERSFSFSLKTPVTPNVREESVPTGRLSIKRPVSQIIDLTLSDDDEPPRPTKRNTALPTPSSMASGSGYLGLTNGYSPVGTPLSYFHYQDYRYGGGYN